MTHSKTLLLEGHIIDSMMLPQLLDLVMDLGGSFDIQELKVGQRKQDPSTCRIEVSAEDGAKLDEIVRLARELGARVSSEEPVNTARVTQEGVYPEGFYSTSNLPTQVLLNGGWVEVERQEMDCAVAIDRGAKRAWCIPFYEANPGLEVVVGRAGDRRQDPGGGRAGGRPHRCRPLPLPADRAGLRAGALRGQRDRGARRGGRPFRHRPRRQRGERPADRTRARAPHAGHQPGA